MDGYCAVCGKKLCNHWKYRINGVTSKCLVCGEVFDTPHPTVWFVPMYEGRVVNPDIQEWAGYEACRECSNKSLELISKR